MSPRFLLVLLLITGLVSGCGKGSIGDFGSSIIANGGIRVKHHLVTLHVIGAPAAVIDADGTLQVDSLAVPTNDAQRELLKQYYLAATAVREHGIATGKEGIALALESAKDAIASIFSGDEDKARERAKAGSNKVVQEAMKICLDLASIRTLQNSLGTQLQAFKPYANIIQVDASHCRKGSDD